MAIRKKTSKGISKPKGQAVKDQAVKRIRVDERDIEKIADLVASKINVNLGGDSSSYDIDCSSRFSCRFLYDCSGGFTCYTFHCADLFSCETGNRFVCPATFDCSVRFTHPPEPMGW